MYAWNQLDEKTLYIIYMGCVYINLVTDFPVSMPKLGNSKLKVRHNHYMLHI